jgi:hypothetical protein
MLKGILAGEDIGSGRDGFFLASPGSVAWPDMYEAIGRALAKRGVVDDATVKPATDEIQSQMGVALGRPAEQVPFELGGT